MNLGSSFIMLCRRWLESVLCEPSIEIWIFLSIEENILRIFFLGGGDC